LEILRNRFADLKSPDGCDGKAWHEKHGQQKDSGNTQ